MIKKYISLLLSLFKPSKKKKIVHKVVYEYNKKMLIVFHIKSSHLNFWFITFLFLKNLC